MEDDFPETMNQFMFDNESLLRFSGHQFTPDDIGNVGQQLDGYDSVEDPGVVLDNQAQAFATAPPAGLNTEGDFLEVSDFSDACLKYMSEILMEESMEDQLPSTSEGFSALEAHEKEFYDALNSTSQVPSGVLPSFSSLSLACLGHGLNDTPGTLGSHGYNAGDQNHAQSESCSTVQATSSSSAATKSGSSPSSNSYGDSANDLLETSSSIPLPTEATSVVDLDWLREAMKYIPDLACQCQPGCEGCQRCSKGRDQGPFSGKQARGSREKRNYQWDGKEDKDARSNKHIAVVDDNEEELQMEQYDDVLLSEGIEAINFNSGCLKGSSDNAAGGKPPQNGKSKGSKHRSSRAKKPSIKSSDENKELIDLTDLLNHCAQAVAGFDVRSAKDLIKKIRQHSSPLGDSIQRLAHYFANGFEARIDGDGRKSSPNLYSNRRVSATDVLKAHRAYVHAIPFKRTSYFVANQTIAKFAEAARNTDRKRTKIHIIDLDIFFGLQWPCFIQLLSKTPGGSPELHMTGVDYPERGFRPAKAVHETGQRLAGYCERFGVPFEYHGIAKKLETLQPEDFEIAEDEVVVVNSLYAQKRLPDETLEANNPRDAYFKLIRKLNPDLFIEGVVNAAFNAPFFITRFREALFFYSSVYDLFEATMPRGSRERMMIERELYGRIVQNVIACEDAAREERPETYRQWHGRTLRAGFVQVPLDQEFLNRAKDKVKANYHKDFVLGEDNHWMIQGWKGRVLYALSIWKPA